MESSLGVKLLGLLILSKAEHAITVIMVTQLSSASILPRPQTMWDYEAEGDLSRALHPHKYTKCIPREQENKIEINKYVTTPVGRYKVNTSHTPEGQVKFPWWVA